MTQQKPRKFEGGKQVAEKGGLDNDLVEVAQDFETLRTKFNALLAQLDTEGGLGGGYVTAHGISSLKTIE